MDEKVEALFKSISSCNDAEVIALFDQGVDVNSKNKSGFTSLIAAIFNQASSNLIKELVLRGADVNVKHSMGFNSLTAAAMLGNLEHVKILLGAGADLEMTDMDCNTPLLCAMTRRHYPIVAYLLDKGGNMHHVNAKGDDFKSLINQEEYLDLKSYLLSHNEEGLLNSIIENDQSSVFPIKF